MCSVCACSACVRACIRACDSIYWYIIELCFNLFLVHISCVCAVYKLFFFEQKHFQGFLLSAKWFTCRTQRNYAKWHVILNAIQYTDGYLAINDLFRKSRFPKSSQLGDDRSMDCVEFVEMAMPFALARPFVDKYITDDLRSNVSGALIRIFYINCDCSCWTVLL